MKKILSLCCVTLFLTACSGTNVRLLDTQTHSYSGGQRLGNTVSYFWYTENNSNPVEASDHVVSDKDGWYESNYRWGDAGIRDVRRDGQMMKDGQRVPFSVHIRYNSDGEAVYQLYQVNGKVFPLSDVALTEYLQHGQEIATFTKQQDKQGLSLIQGFWDGERFETCDGNEYSSVEFAQTLPNFVVDRLSSIDNYLVLLGRIKNGRVYMSELLVLDDDGHECVEKPSLAEN